MSSASAPELSSHKRKFEIVCDDPKLKAHIERRLRLDCCINGCRSAKRAVCWCPRCECHACSDHYNLLNNLCLKCWANGEIAECCGRRLDIEKTGVAWALGDGYSMLVNVPLCCWLHGHSYKGWYGQQIASGRLREVKQTTFQEPLPEYKARIMSFIQKQEDEADRQLCVHGEQRAMISADGGVYDWNDCCETSISYTMPPDL